MSGQKRRRCPVCWQTVLPTPGRYVNRHWDSAGRDICPMSGEPYRLTEVGRRRYWVADVGRPMHIEAVMAS